MDNSSHNSSRVLLAVLAHPDDESFGMGGTLALYAKRGVAVHLVCATRGEVGEVEPQHLENYQSIGDLREAELSCAAGMLGLAGIHFLGYRDSGMIGSRENAHPQALTNAPLDEVAAKVACYIRRLRPQVVLTFDPIGGYRHPDHIAIQRATVKAFQSAGDPQTFPCDYPTYQPQKLYFHTFPHRMLRWAVRLMPLFGKDPHHFGINGDIDLVPLAEVDFPVHARIIYKEVLEKKEAAAACHASQGSMGASSGLMRFALRRVSGIDQFMRAFPPAEPRLKEGDLFAGVQVETASQPDPMAEIQR